MSRRLGARFLNAARGPVSFAGQALLAARVREGLAELCIESLMGSVQRGIAEVASATGLAPGDIGRLLPLAQMEQTVGHIAQHQHAAAEQWARHVHHAGGLLEGIAKLTVDGRPPDVPLCLTRIATKMRLEKELAEPLLALAEDIELWDQQLCSCRAIIDDGRELERAHRRRRRLRMGVVATALIVLAAASAGVVRQRDKRLRIDAALAAASDDPCAAERLDPSDADSASETQQQQLAALRQQCVADRARAQRQAAALVAQKAREKEKQQRREQRLQLCQKLADSLASPGLPAAVKPVAGRYFALFERVAQDALAPADVAVDVSAFVCKSTPAAVGIGAAYSRAAFASASLWITKHSPSASAVKLMALGKGQLSEYGARVFGQHVVTVAKDAVLSGDDELLERAARLCRFAAALGMPSREQCKAALTLAPKQ